MELPLSNKGPEQFVQKHGASVIRRIVSRRNGGSSASTIKRIKGRHQDGHDYDLQSAFECSWLRSQNWPPLNPIVKKHVRTADLFCGCGAMSLGVWEACRALQLKMIPTFAVDLNADAVATYTLNFETKAARVGDIFDFIDGELGQRETCRETAFKNQIGEIDILMGGPPCQGHSDLNNHTRRNDPKNLLIFRMARFAELFRPKHVIIENVQGIRHDKNSAAQKTKAFLQSIGYNVDDGLILGSHVGVAQRRRRFFMVASLVVIPQIAKMASDYVTTERTIEWACQDLVDVKGTTTFDTAAQHSHTNVERINYLFDHNIYDLPDIVRPDCHRLKAHDYKAVYGRLRPKEPAPTITTGFGSTGQGRFVHPLRRRTITPHEAARLQFIPDFFKFGDIGRRSMQLLIGNAVPPKMAYVIALDLLR